MRKSRFSEEQKVKMVREAEQRPIAEVAKKHGVSVETLYRWRRAYGGMELPEVGVLSSWFHWSRGTPVAPDRNACTW